MSRAETSLKSAPYFGHIFRNILGIFYGNMFHVDVVMCLKGSDDNDEHNHLVISDLVSILRFEKSG